MPTLSHEVIVADVVYPAVLLAFGRIIALLEAMVGCIQSGLQVLIKTFCKVEALVDDDGNVLIIRTMILSRRCLIPKSNSQHLLGGMICYVLSIFDADSAGIRELCAIPVEAGAQLGNIYIYMFFIRRTI